MVNGSSSTSRVSSNFAPARTAPGVHSTPCRRFYFLQMETAAKGRVHGLDECIVVAHGSSNFNIACRRPYFG